jgi:hypothetical protein
VYINVHRGIDFRIDWVVCGWGKGGKRREEFVLLRNAPYGNQNEEPKTYDLDPVAGEQSSVLYEEGYLGDDLGSIIYYDIRVEALSLPVSLYPNITLVRHKE